MPKILDVIQKFKKATSPKEETKKTEASPLETPKKR
jgi:hypothetical protein